MLDTHSSVTVSQLSEIFRISDVSVRKLLAAMEQEGLVKRTWGGAISAYGSLNEFSHKEKEWKHTEEKLSIAYAAYECISDGDAVFLDCGTTTTQLARVIRSGSKRKILVGTNAINIAMELSEAEDISVIVIGGNFRHRIPFLRRRLCRGYDEKSFSLTKVSSAGTILPWNTVSPLRTFRRRG